MPSRPHKSPPKPPLTHFLCLPLLTPTSIPQLKASLAHLKSTIEAMNLVQQKEEDEVDVANNSSSRTRSPLIPPTAFRPLGTLHLTLGVMSLKDPEKLAGALKLLQDLDLEAMLRDASESSAEDIVADVASLNSLRGVEEDQPPLSQPAPPVNINGDGDIDGSLLSDTQMSSPRDNTSDNGHNSGNSHEAVTEAEAKVEHHATPPPLSLTRPISPPPISKSPTHQDSCPPQYPISTPTTADPLSHSISPLSVSLSGLSTFPPNKPQRATVLHTTPHDSTSRLYPFCLRLLSQFKEAGYLLPEPEGKERELTLHATLINTVYAKGSRARNQKGRSRGGRGGDKRLTFDVREILRLFNNEEGEGTSTFPTTSAKDQHPTHPVTTTTSPFRESNVPSLSPSSSTSTKDQDVDDTAISLSSHVNADSASPDEDKDNLSTAQTAKLYTFASSIPISSIQICEMGAKNLDPDSDIEGFGQKYTVVGEKKFFSTNPPVTLIE